MDGDIDKMNSETWQTELVAEFKIMQDNSRKDEAFWFEEYGKKYLKPMLEFAGFQGGNIDYETMDLNLNEYYIIGVTDFRY